jgi:hypothetical protein
VVEVEVVEVVRVGMVSLAILPFLLRAALACSAYQQVQSFVARLVQYSKWTLKLVQNQIASIAKLHLAVRSQVPLSNLAPAPPVGEVVEVEVEGIVAIQVVTRAVIQAATVALVQTVDSNVCHLAHNCTVPQELCWPEIN